MDTTQFRDHLKELGLSYAGFADLIGTTVSNVKISVSREKIPDEWKDAVTNRLQEQVVTGHKGPVDDRLQESVTTPVTTVPRDESAQILRKSADGKPEWDIMADGYARGFPGDSKLIRVNYRTPSAYRRILEAADPKLATDRVKMPAGDFKINREGKPVLL